MRSTKVMIECAAFAALIAACGASAPLVAARSDVASVQVSIDAQAVTVGAQAKATARILDGAGNTLDRTIAWTSSNSALASVSSSGIISGVAAGTVQITATVDGKGGS